MVPQWCPIIHIIIIIIPKIVIIVHQQIHPNSMDIMDIYPNQWYFFHVFSQHHFEVAAEDFVERRNYIQLVLGMQSWIQGIQVVSQHDS